MSKIARKNIKLLIYLIIFFVLYFFLISNDLIKYDSFIKVEFLFTFIGVFIGFSISLYTYITSIFDKILFKISQRYKNDKIKSKEKENLLVDVHSGIRDDINFMVGGLLIVIILTLGDNLINDIAKNHPIIITIISSILLTIFTLTILAIRDIIKIAFIFSDFLAKRNGFDYEE